MIDTMARLKTYDYSWNNEWLGLSLSPKSIDVKRLYIWWGNSCISGICVNYNMSKIYGYKLLAHSEDENFIVD